MTKSQNIALLSYQKVSELPLEYRRYTLTMNNKSIYSIRRIEYETIFSSTSQFIELYSGDAINKAYIIEIQFDKNATKEAYIKSLENNKNE